MLKRRHKLIGSTTIIAALAYAVLLTSCEPAVTIPGTPIIAASPMATSMIQPAVVTQVKPAATVSSAPSSTPNLTPSATSALVAAMSLTPNLTPVATNAPFVPEPGAPPPLTLTLPKGWRATYTRLPVVDQVGEALINVAAYAGPVTGEAQTTGTGFIYVLWNYPSLAPANPGALPKSVTDFQKQQILGDAYRLLRGTVFDVSCTFGTYGHNDFMIGKLPAYGQTFQSTACQDNSPDVVGWYAGLYQDGTSLLFYAYIQPVADYNLGRPDLQTVLDSVVFNATTTVSTATAAPILTKAVPSTFLPTGTAELN